jgi:hypothetical protein
MASRFNDSSCERFSLFFNFLFAIRILLSRNPGRKNGQPDGLPVMAEMSA